jgi:DNA-binding transcriptional ArsR family regulator
MIDRVAKGLSHPLRAQILRTLEERRASPSDLSEQLDAPLGNVSYHVRVLLDLKLIKLVESAPRRGAIEHYYEAVSGVAEVSRAAWTRGSGLAKQAVVASALAEIGQEVASTAAAGGFDADDAHLSRTTLVLDHRAKAELDDRLKDLMRDVSRLQHESSKRTAIKGRASDAAQAGLVVMLYTKDSDSDVPDESATAATGISRRAASTRGASTRASSARASSKRRQPKRKTSTNRKMPR